MTKLSRPWGWLALGLASATALAAPPPTPSTAERIPAMQQFALIFHPGRGLDAADLPRRNSAAREWALALRRGGALEVASPLEDAGFRVSSQAVLPVAPQTAIASVLIVKARDLQAAVELAKGHPGLAFGTEIEVRPVKPVPPPAPARP